MWHYIVVEIEQTLDVYGAMGPQKIQCPCWWRILYKVPVEREDLGEEALSFKGCLAWIENNKAEGSEYAVMKMYLI